MCIFTYINISMCLCVCVSMITGLHRQGHAVCDGVITQTNQDIFICTPFIVKSGHIRDPEICLLFNVKI